ncbi:DUF6086 family protein [Streptomyces sp. NPDC088358]|uniref:DUF6086 family protein n=1 Tax=Streptomyces sp. NPDC088358 TaxID=3365857 RepID=UPI003823D227
MSQYYALGGQTLWNPSNGASRLFLRQVALFETELGLPSGIGPMESDECQIAPVAFKAFADALLARHRRTTHAVMIALSEGFVSTVLVLARRADIELAWNATGSAAGDQLTDLQVPAPPAPDQETWAADLRQRSLELGRFMAR